MAAPLQLYDHAIFVTYSLAFMMLLVIVLTIAGDRRGRAGCGATCVSRPDARIFVPPVHMFAQLRGAYSLRHERSALFLLVGRVVALPAHAHRGTDARLLRRTLFS